jgi:branched-chain amino acid transport system ATP-binding protein
MLLHVRSVHTFYSESHILFGVDLEVGEGEIVALLGRNGAGKTTTLRSIMGLTAPRAGDISFRGNAVTGLQPYQVCRMGMAFVPEERRIFPRLTVQENLEISAHQTGRKCSWTIARIYDWFPRLRERKDHGGHQLSGGEQQMLTIGRALMSNPSLILLDEPSEGLAPAVVKILADAIKAIRAEGISILLVEQNAHFACKLSDRAYVLDDGRVCFGGSIAELEQDPLLKARYLSV